MNNPFDQFAGTLQAALPPSDGSIVPSVASGAPQQQQQLQPAPQFSLMAQPTQEKKPIMGGTGMGGGAMVQAQGGGGGMYGQQQNQLQPHQGGGMMPYGQQPPQGGMGGMYGQQPPPQQQQLQLQQQPPQNNQMMMMSNQSMMGGFGAGAPAPPQQTNAIEADPRSSWGSNNGIGMAPPMQQLTNGGPPAPNAMAGALVPSAAQSNPYALGPANASANPFGAPAQLGAPGVPPQQQQLQQQQAGNPFGAPALGAPPVQPALGAPPPQHQPAALGAPPPQANSMMAMDPFSAPAPAQLQQGGFQPQPPAPQQLAADPWGAPQPVPPQQPQGGFQPAALPPAQHQQQQSFSSAIVPSGAPPGSDPFGVFGGGPAPPANNGYPPSSQASVAPSVAVSSAVGAPPSVYPSQNTVVPPPAQPAAADPWAEMGFGTPAPAPVANVSATHVPSGPVPGEDDDLFDGGLQPTRDQEDPSRSRKPPADADQTKPNGSPKRKKGELPPGGEWYDAKIFTPTLGVMFFKPKELVDSLFLQTEKKLVDSLDERPVVAFIVEGSSARSAGVELGHVLLKVNGIDVKNPKEASRLIKEGPRPLPLLFYVPETSVVVAEGEHMVKYNTKETGAPNSAKDWKPKYCVIGGIIAQPWMMNMYRSKSEYDIAVIETQARRPVSVKVKQFSLQGARVQNDWQGPQMVKYKNKLHPWKYIVILPISRNPIKIASPNLSQLKPVHEGIRRVLMAQQRDRGSGGGQGGGGGGGRPQRGPDPNAGGGYDSRTRETPPRNGGNTSPGAYYGGRPTTRGY